MTINSAKYYYEKFHLINPPRLGPYYNPQKITKEQCQQLEILHKTYWPNIQQEIDQLKNDSRDGEISVPSPWHAWALLTASHLKLLEINSNQWNVPANFVVPAYRGHESTDYKPIPSLYRPNIDRTHQINCLDAFSFIFNQKFLWRNLGISPPPDSAKATAQHYGIKTDLLDITADPAIAVYFASSANNKKQDETAAVLVFDLARLLDSNVKLILPPPIVERLYIQRGTFLQLSEERVTSIGKESFKITFPPDPTFQLIENGKQKNILLSDDWFQKVLDWSNKWVALKKPLPSTQTEINDLLTTVFEDIGHPNFTQCNPSIFLAHWIDQFEDMIYWYAIRINGDSEGLLSGACENIAKNNPELVRLAINTYNSQASGDQTKVRLRDIWTKALSANHL